MPVSPLMMTEHFLEAIVRTVSRMDSKAAEEPIKFRYVPCCGVALGARTEPFKTVRFFSVLNTFRCAEALSLTLLTLQQTPYLRNLNLRIAANALSHFLKYWWEKLIWISAFHTPPLSSI